MSTSTQQHDAPAPISSPTAGPGAFTICRTALLATPDSPGSLRISTLDRSETIHIGALHPECPVVWMSGGNNNDLLRIAPVSRRPEAYSDRDGRVDTFLQMLTLPQVLTALAAQEGGRRVGAVGTAWQTLIPLADQRIWFERRQEEGALRLCFRSPFLGWSIAGHLYIPQWPDDNHPEDTTYTFRVDLVDFQPADPGALSLHFLPPDQRRTFAADPPFEVGLLPGRIAFVRRCGRVFLSSDFPPAQDIYRQQESGGLLLLEHEQQQEEDAQHHALAVRTLVDLVRLIVDGRGVRVECHEDGAAAIVNLRTIATGKPLQWHGHHGLVHAVRDVDVRFYDLLAPHRTAEALVALCMGLHGRLGRDSPLRALDSDLLRLVFRCAQEEVCSWRQ